MLIPSFAVRDIREALAFYTGILDFQVASVMNAEAPFYAVLTRRADELHLTLRAGSAGRCSAIVVCDDVDALFATFKARGLVVPARPELPFMKGRWTKAGARARSISTIR